MKRWFLSSALLLGLLGLAACASAKEATPAPAGPTSAARAPWEEEWARVLAAAKQEGKVAVVATGVGSLGREALTDPFQKKYGIAIEFITMEGAEAAPRFEIERAAGQYLWDVYLGGTTTMITALKPKGTLDPIEPTLILPEVKDPKNWLGGQLEFADKDRLTLVMMSYSKTPIYVNSNLVKPGEIKSVRDLLDPKWKGKILSGDPRVAGPGQATFSFFYAHKDLGPNFIQELAKQDVTLVRDYRTPVEWLAQGKYPILLGGAETTAAPMIKEGLPIKMLDPKQLKEGGYMTSSNGTITLVNKAPHPNAAKIYINWLLSKEGQTVFARSQGYSSRRLDVPNGDW
ncbi:MAG TPA: extracellular solute-binding protein, partial [Dehalococcoidia bacterium]|nr:extracellular solute-binding protein [Dehalococcoidia bacterium]